MVGGTSGASRCESEMERSASRLLMPISRYCADMKNAVLTISLMPAPANGRDLSYTPY